MTTSEQTLDFSQGVALDQLPDAAIVAGHIGDDELLLIRRGDAVFAVGAHCTHYHGPLAQGLVVGDTIRCPLHHACFGLRSGEAVAAPAFDAIPTWRVETVGDRIFVREKLVPPPQPAAAGGPSSVVIVGGGGAAFAAAEMLRREGYQGAITMVSADDTPPCDRPNLSKDYLAGEAEEDWIPLQSAEFYATNHIDVLLDARATSIDVAHRRLLLADGRALEFGALLIATGAEPVKLTIPGAAPDQVKYLRSFSDSRALVAELQQAKSAVIIGASFIALEVAASCRARGIDVHVVAPDHLPLERVLGADVGAFIKTLHEQHGVRFHLGATVARLDGRKVTLTSGEVLDSDLVIAGVGVRPATALAEQAGLAVDHGILVDEYLQTAVSGIYAAGDVARWLDRRTGSRMRVEHWVLAERAGQAAARNMLGRREVFDVVPFFWSRHYDVSIRYVGHAESWDAIRIDGRIDDALTDAGCSIAYVAAGRRLAVATIGRNVESLQVEAEMEREKRA